jgi:predicted unusual protein kinase regulating ubiquinone biosynthesis (AarF/ABC1/UbiB family)
MKLGQLLSFIDLGLLPDDVRPRFQARLAALCDTAPPIPYAAMEPVLTAALGGPVEQVFASFEPEPIGTASIGQVYRATTRDGRDVAVKVQYPKIVAAARADLKNLALLLRFAKGILPGVDLPSLATELTDRLVEELDYTREAASTREMADAFAGHPLIVVPAPVEELCRAQLLVTEYVAGADFAQLCAQPAADRDRAGEILVRFYFGSLFRGGRFSGDPHPGNVKLLPDGRLGFLDFGSFQRLDERMLAIIGRTLRAVSEDRGADALQLFADQHILQRPDQVGADDAMGYFHDTCGWFLVDEVQTMTPRVASEAILQSIAPPTGDSTGMRGQNLPVEWSLMIRTTVSAMALLGQLRASANWHRIAREWVYRDAPQTELGQLEADFFAR